MVKTDDSLTPADLKERIARFWELSGEKILLLEKEYDPSQGSPVFTVGGKYTTRGWTEWTQGFELGSYLLQYDATGEESFLLTGRRRVRKEMTGHVSHTGVHDHGFNNLSTYGNLLRLVQEGKVTAGQYEADLYRMALKLSGAVQATRWTPAAEGGYIYSFNGPHSLFVDTIRSCRILMVAHALGHVLQGEGDRRISLLERALTHMKTTAGYSIYYGEGRDIWDVRGRVAHESIFNINNGTYRCPSTQQGYSPFSTWTRGLAWAMLGFAEELEFITLQDEKIIPGRREKEAAEKIFREAAAATCDFYLLNTPSDGIPYWDTGAPGLNAIPDYLNRPADPFNDQEPVDSSAAAIAAQGLLRFGHYLKGKGEEKDAARYWQGGLTVAAALLEEPYLSTDPAHQGLLLHTVYHRPNGWDHIPPGSRVPHGESGMWGDYHVRELMLYLQRLDSDEPYYTFFNCLS